MSVGEILRKFRKITPLGLIERNEQVNYLKALRDYDRADFQVSSGRNHQILQNNRVLGMKIKAQIFCLLLQSCWSIGQNSESCLRQRVFIEE